MIKELEILTAGGLGAVLKRKSKPHEPPAPGALCPNCDALLAGAYCAACGQPADLRHRSILRLMAEGVESLLHLDGRLWRTLPALFLKPGRLGKDYLEGRIARHAPPFRLFLVALLIFIVSAEHFVDQIRRDAETRAPPPLSASQRAQAAQAVRLQAAARFERRVSKAARDRAQASTRAARRAGAAQAYQGALVAAQKERDRELGEADQLASGALPANGNLLFARGVDRKALSEQLRSNIDIRSDGAFGAALRLSLAKALDNPDYYLTVMFGWAHRMAVLLLPIVAAFLSLVYVYNKKFYVYDHLIIAMGFLSFLFLSYALGFWLPKPMNTWWFWLLLLWAPVNLFMTLRGAYGSSVAGATLKAAGIWAATALSFLTLVLGLMLFTLFQL